MIASKQLSHLAEHYSVKFINIYRHVAVRIPHTSTCNCITDAKHCQELYYKKKKKDAASVGPPP